MNKAQAAAVKELLQVIELEEMVHRQKMEARRQELMTFVPYFESYGEMYAFVKQNTPSLDAFCRDMNEATEIYWRTR